VLLAPLRAGTAHVVTLRQIRVGQTRHLLCQRRTTTRNIVAFDEVLNVASPMTAIWASGERIKSATVIWAARRRRRSIFGH
jgi:hypothetical protein